MAKQEKQQQKNAKSRTWWGRWQQGKKGSQGMQGKVQLVGAELEKIYEELGSGGSMTYCKVVGGINQILLWTGTYHFLGGCNAAEDEQAAGLHDCM